MAQNTFALMTNLGRAKEAAAIANGTAVVITHIAIGDGTTVPSGGETALYHEVARKAISGHGTVVGASNVAYFDIFLEASEGPYTIREAGLIDQDGDLIAIARYDPPISKPIPSSGQTVEGTIRLEVAFSNIANITIVVEPSFAIPMQRLTRLPWLPVISMTQVTPPLSPVLGDAYVIPTGANGAWTGQAGKVAEFTSAGWAVMAPPDGHGVSLPDGRVFERVGSIYVEKIALDVQSGKWSYAAAGGSANALTVALDPVPAAYVAGMRLLLLVSTTNTAATTIKVGGLAALPIIRADGYPVKAGDIVAGALLPLTYDPNRQAFQIEGLLSAKVPMGNFRQWVTPGTSSWTVPDGVSRVRVRVWGAGGGGGGAFANSGSAGAGGAGGSGGGYCEGYFSVLPGQVISVTVGSGGAGGSSPLDGSPGGTSSFGSLISATGGAGGLGGNNAGTGPTSGVGTGSGGSFSVDGNFGAGGGIDASGTGPYRGGGGGGSFGSSNSHAANNSSPGIFPGGGGGGSGVTGAGGYPGGNGATGMVLVEW